ncbi:hypothetical protein PAXINDRAFT_88314, partial [Paxillus involutus ATCC 200175]
MPQLNWAARVGNQLLAEQLAYDHGELQQMVGQDYPNLNEGQKRIYDEVLESSVNGQRGDAYFVHSAGGCGKTHLFNLIAAGVRSAEKVVLCVASSGIASLLLSGGRTAHSWFKIPIPVHEDSTCNIKKEDQHHQLLRHTALII